MSSHSEASGALVRAPKPPIFGTPTFSVGPTSLIRPISIGNVANRPTFGRIENSASSTLTGALSLPRDTKVIVTVTSDEEPFTRLRKSAEEMIRSQITSGMERDMSSSKMSQLEQENQALAAKIQKLRSDKSQLQSLLELEKATLTKLEFDYRSLQTLVDGLKAQATRFQENVDIAASDSKSFKSMVSVMDEGIKDLELRVSSALETAEVKEQECFILRAKVEELELHIVDLNLSIDARVCETSASMSERDEIIAALRHNLAVEGEKSQNLDEALKNQMSELLRLESSVADLSLESEQLKDRNSELEATEVELRRESAQKAEENEAIMSQLSRTVDSLRSQLDTMEAEVNAQKVEYDRIMESMAVLRLKAKARKADAKTRFLELEEAISEEQSAHASTTSSLESVKEAYARFREEAQMEVAQRDEAMKELKSTSDSSLEAANSIIHTTRKELETLKEEGARTGTSHKSELADLKRSMLGMVKERDESISYLKAQLESATKESKKIDKDRNASMAEIEKASKKTSEELEKTKKLLEKEVAKRTSAEEASKQSKTEITELKKCLKLSKSELDAAKRAAEEIGEKATSEIEESNARFQEQIASIQDELGTLKAILEEKTEEAVTAKREMEEKDGEIVVLKKYIADTKASREEKEKEVATLRKKLSSDSKAAKETLEKEIATLRSSLETSSSAIIAQKDAEIATLRDKLNGEDIMMIEITQLRKRVTELSARQPVPLPEASAPMIEMTLPNSFGVLPGFPTHTMTEKPSKSSTSTAWVSSAAKPSSAGHIVEKMEISPKKRVISEDDEYDLPSQKSPVASKPSSPLSLVRSAMESTASSNSTVDTPIPKLPSKAGTNLSRAPTSRLSWGSKSNKSLPPSPTAPKSTKTSIASSKKTSTPTASSGLTKSPTKTSPLQAPSSTVAAAPPAASSKKSPSSPKASTTTKKTAASTSKVSSPQKLVVKSQGPPPLPKQSSLPKTMPASQHSTKKSVGHSDSLFDEEYDPFGL